MHRLMNPQMNYAWGSVDLLPALMGSVPNGVPVAEIWMGAHSAAPSSIEVDGRAVALNAFIERSPERALGVAAVPAARTRLPYMLKLLAAEKPLSLQVHPTQAQAVEGFQRENAAGLGPRDPKRNYRDDEHKPEMLYALTPFELLGGFRTADAIHELLAGLGVTALQPLLSALSSGESGTAIKEAFTILLTATTERQAELTQSVVLSAREQAGRSEYRLVGELANYYPDDIGVVASLFLNHLRIEPGESVFVGAGMVHSYIRGFGVELMAPSDDVLRAGLTSKHVDVAELLRLVDFTPGEPQRLDPTPAGPANVYVPPVRDFALWTYTRSSGGEMTGAVQGPPAGARIAVCCSGQATLIRDTERLDLTPGQAAFIPDSDGLLEIRATGEIAVAFSS